MVESARTKADRERALAKIAATDAAISAAYASAFPACDAETVAALSMAPAAPDLAARIAANPLADAAFWFRAALYSDDRQWRSDTRAALSAALNEADADRAELARLRDARIAALSLLDPAGSPDGETIAQVRDLLRQARQGGG